MIDAFLKLLDRVLPLEKCLHGCGARRRRISRQVLPGNGRQEGHRCFGANHKWTERYHKLERAGW
jgi:hypothetical protein